MFDFEVIPFEDYKKIDAINYSLLKRVADSGHLYKFEKDDKKSDSMDLGTLVDDLLLSEERDMYYFLSTEPPTATTLDLADLVIKHCIKQGLSFADLKKLNDTEDTVYKILDQNELWKRNSEEVRRKNFTGNAQFYNYIESKLAARNGKMIVSPSQWEKANQLSEILKSHKYTKDIFSKGLNQVTYTFNINGVKYKIRLDKLIIDAEKKTISPFDLKTGSPSAHKFEANFWMFKYYLQHSLYSLGVQHLASKYFPDYTVENFKFIYISTTEFNPYPIIWEMSEKWAELGYDGFTSRGRFVKGIQQLVNELKFYETYGHEVPKEVYEGGGVIQMELPD